MLPLPEKLPLDDAEGESEALGDTVGLPEPEPDWDTELETETVAVREGDMVPEGVTTEDAEVALLTLGLALPDALLPSEGEALALVPARDGQG